MVKRRFNYIDLIGWMVCAHMYADEIFIGWIFIVAVITIGISLILELSVEKAYNE